MIPMKENQGKGQNIETSPMISNNDYTILIVDDTKTNIDVLVKILMKDYRLGVALNGRDAIQFARKNQPDLILLDIIMPEMDGFQVCGELKSDPRTKSIPIIFITAMNKPGLKAKCIEYGAVDYINKPFVMREVKEKITIHLIPS